MSLKKVGRPKKVLHDLSENQAKLRLMEVAAELFAQKGLEGVSTRDIAKKSGLNISLISYYFGGKMGLYKEIIRASISESVEQISFMLSANKNKGVLTPQIFKENLKFIIELLLEGFQDKKDVHKIMEWERLQGMPNTKNLQEEIIDPIADNLFSLIKEGQKRGFIRKEVNPDTFFVLFFESICSYARSIDSGLSFHGEAYRLPQETEQLVDFFLELFFRGILK